MKEAAVLSGLLALIANSEIVSLFLILCWACFLMSRLFKAAEDRRN